MFMWVHHGLLGSIGIDYWYLLAGSLGQKVGSKKSPFPISCYIHSCMKKARRAGKMNLDESWKFYYFVTVSLQAGKCQHSVGGKLFSI